MIKLTDIGANVAIRVGTPVTVTAGGGADNVAQNDKWTNRAPLTDTGLPAFSSRIEGPYQSAVLAFILNWTLAAAATVTFSAQPKTASDGNGTGAANYGTAIAAAVVATGPGGGGSGQTVVRTNITFNLSTAGPWVGSSWTADLSAANTDTCVVTPVWIFGGSDVLPVV